jgi:very-short-patch-repair endonuclease
MEGKKLKKRSKNRSPVAKNKARRYRRDMSASEQVLWRSLRKKGTGFSFRRQVPIGTYTLDFYCSEASLCVEVDGEHHLDRQEADQIRDLFLHSRGIVTIRIRSLDLFEEHGVLHAKAIEKVVAACEFRSGRRATEARRGPSTP